jgi:hypothetical protein
VYERRPVDLVGSKSLNETVDRLEWSPAQIQTPLGDLSVTICDLMKKIIRFLFCIAAVPHTGQTEDPVARVGKSLSIIVSQHVLLSKSADSAGSAAGPCDFEDEMIAQFVCFEISFC